MNPRPLLFVYSEASELQLLIPSHFLVGGRLISLLPSQVTSKSQEDMGPRWRWNCWWKKFLMDVKSSHKYETPTPTLVNIGDVVLIGQDNLPRQTCKKGRITELCLGKDGCIY